MQCVRDLAFRSTIEAIPEENQCLVAVEFSRQGLQLNRETERVANHPIAQHLAS